MPGYALASVMRYWPTRGGSCLRFDAQAFSPPLAHCASSGRQSLHNALIDRHYHFDLRVRRAVAPALGGGLTIKQALPTLERAPSGCPRWCLLVGPVLFAAETTWLPLQLPRKACTSVRRSGKTWARVSQEPD